jgi:uncharacterized protein (TIGR02444 family)
MSLWDWAAQAYARPGVKAACLTLQDAHSQCVSFILWALWLQAQGRAPTRQGLARAAALARSWEIDALRPLRAARRALKALAAHPDHGDLYAQALATELNAEGGLMRALETAAIATRAEPASPLGALTAAAAAWSAELPSNSALEALAQAFSAP